MSDPRPTRDFVPDITLERYALGELPRSTRIHLDIRLGEDPSLRQRLETLRASNATLLAENPPEAFAHQMRTRARREEAEKPFRVSLRLELPRGAKPALAAFALLALVAGPAWWALQQNEGMGGTPVGETVSGDTPPKEDTRIKGLEPRLAVFRRTTDGAEALLPGEKARPGDVLRVGYQAGGFTHGAIFSVDGGGNVTRHWPPQGETAGALRSGEVLLPSAFKLDASPGYERFFLIVSDRGFALNPVLETLHTHRDIPSVKWNQNTRVVRFDILKEDGI